MPPRSGQLPLSLLFAAVLLMILTGARAVAQESPVTVFAGFDRTHGTVGDPVHLTVTVRYAAGVAIDTDNLESQFGPFETLDASPADDTRNLDGSGERRLRFTITAYQTGRIDFPALTVSYTSDGQSAQAQGQPLSYQVDSVIPAGDSASDIRPLKPQITLPFGGGAALRWIIAAAVASAVVVVAGLVLLLRRRRRPDLETVEAVPAERRPEEFARAELDALADRRLLDVGAYREHYAVMAETIRRYITVRYGFPASALTTTELGLRMEAGGVGRWRARLVAGLLAECDAVHYAHYVPAPARADADLQMAYEIVDLALSQQTRPDETALEAGGS